MGTGNGPCNVVTIATGTGRTIDGYASIILAPKQAVYLVAFGGNVNVLSSYDSKDTGAYFNFQCA